MPVPMEKYHLILFDADGTLFDYELAEKEAVEKTCVKHGMAYSPSVLAIYREENERLWTLYEQGKVSIEDLKLIRFENMFRRCGVSGISTGDFAADYVIHLSQGNQLLPGAYDVCRVLAGTKTLAIATNGIAPVQNPRLAHSAIRPFIQCMGISTDAGYAKPDPRYFDYLLALCQHKEKTDVLMVGDSLAADIQGGNAAGIDTCWFNPAGLPNTTGIIPTYEIRDLKELYK